MKAIPLAAAVSAALLFGTSAIAGGDGPCATDAKNNVSADAAVVAKEDKPPKV